MYNLQPGALPNPDSIVREKTTKTVSANGLIKTTVWADVSNVAIRSQTEMTQLNADGSKIVRTEIRNASNTLERSWTTTTSADGRTTTTVYDKDGNGVADQKEVTVIANSGARMITLTDLAADGVTVLASKTIATTANGLAETILVDRDGNGSSDFGSTVTKTLNLDGSTTVTTTNSDSRPGFAAAAKTTVTTSANGLLVGTQWDVDGNGTTDRSETDNTVINTDGSRTRTISSFSGSTLLQKRAITTSANGLSTTIVRSGVDGINTYGQTFKDVTSVNAAGVKTRSMISERDGGQIFSTVVETTSADGRTVTTREDHETFGSRIITRTTEVHADGSTTETIATTSLAGTLLSKEIATVSADGRVVRIDRDINGDGVRDEFERLLPMAGGGSKRTIRGFVDYTTNRQVTITVSADGLTTTVEHDKNGDGIVERKRVSVVENRAYGARITTMTDTDAAGTLLSKSIISESADRRSMSITTDLDGNGTIDRTETRKIDQAGGSVTTIANTAEGAKEKYVSASDIRWKNTGAVTTEVTTPADGLSSSTRLDYDGDGIFEVVAHSRLRLDGVVATVFTEKNAAGAVIATGQSWRSADGLTAVFQKDVGGNGIIDQKQRSATNIDGSAILTTEDYDAVSGALKQTTVDTIRATGSLLRRVVTDASGRKMSELVVNINDETSVLTGFVEATGAVKSVHQIDKNGKLTSGVLYDAANDQTWTRAEQSFANGEKTLEKQFMDNGDRVDIYYDPSNAQSWSTALNRYDSAGRLAWNRLVNDDGTSAENHYDVAGAQTWSTVAMQFNAAGGKIQERQTMDNGEVFYFFYDPANTQPWSSAIHHYDAAGRLAWEKWTNDNGASGELIHDLGNTRLWSRAELLYDANNKKYAETQYGDDGNNLSLSLNTATGAITAGTLTPTSGTVVVKAGWILEAGGTVAGNVIVERGGVIVTSGTITGSLTVNGMKYTASNLVAPWLRPMTAAEISAYQPTPQQIGTFDAAYYLAQNPDIANDWENGSAWNHFRMYGWKEGRNPNKWFDLAFYKANNPDVVAEGLNPLIHWREWGFEEGRLPYSSYVPLSSDARRSYQFQGHVSGTQFPVLLDLNADSHVDLRPFNPAAPDVAGPRFDWDGDGTRDVTAWAGPADGFLAIDLGVNGAAADGVINQGRELAFASWVDEHTLPEGTALTDLEALRLVFDTNSDNVLDQHDARWNEFRVWQDANQNGVSDVGELKTMSQAGIKLINLMPSTQGTQGFADGSAITGTTFMEMNDGSRQLVGDATLAYRGSSANSPSV